ncbi:thiamine-monophosphate kinase [Abyssogena phaseoliformis symbiont OG214]|uniref:thiamine-phosphate kinase n=1 Tax=Abyssogena phaseoliformis symbiont TaxID=596095 RepID=UPI0019165982|nr:thiamine-phosphate kinase [Abyssogena phaseoliformis symbiont]MBW5289089.1 Thiamine-monophosphate kinase [Candidatus Ruthia sp. Apha_13_S6]BBB22491.1 thiamine-monophosphate kinase [Abyssogena phaseoliformis symbiont OG214]
MNEFSLIETYFNWGSSNLANLGIGDDCAVINIDTNYQLVTSVDTLIESVHFPSNTSASDIAYKSLAVNLSDLAAMGARAKYFTLALTLPNINKKWLSQFSTSLKSLANEFGIVLVGGDTTKGALSITINVTGVVEKNKALLRSSAKMGDLIFVSNTIGNAAYAWKQLQNNQTPSEYVINQFNRPKPQLFLGQQLSDIANACIDISDGLEQDLTHILTRSNVGASINLDDIPLINEVKTYIKKTNDWCLVLAGGDDYELCFTTPVKNMDLLKALQSKNDIKVTQIGIINDSMVLTKIGSFDKQCCSYQHF